jgi:hypothetical protein
MYSAEQDFGDLESNKFLIRRRARISLSLVNLISRRAAVINYSFMRCR